MKSTLSMATLLLLVSCGPSETRASIQMFAASSMTEAITELRDRFQVETGYRVELTLSSSSSLAVQIQSGGEADLFLSANVEWAKAAATNKRGGSRVTDQVQIVSNRLVVVARSDSEQKLTSLVDLVPESVGEIALAETSSVPAGIYAREALEHAGLWQVLHERLIPGSNVRTALGYVETGGIAVGIVYASDAVASPNVKVLFEIDSEMHSPIRYPLMLLRHAERVEGALEFYAYLTSPLAAEVFRRHGFTSAPTPPSR
ncbi:MAG: molybdate ABC transporter substrate-binding protein [Gemmatimonadetes bacterium]|nr:molybdate ABC transporter substrate-binding protein [Gemmatimonadota bacterium]